MSRLRPLVGLGAPIVLVGLLCWSASGLWTAARPGAERQTFEIRRGDSLSSVASRLAEQGLLPERSLFGPRVLVLYGRLAGLDRELKHGEYDVDPAQSPIQILGQLVLGTIKTYSVTLPEGLRLDEVALRLELAGIVAAEAFLEQAHSASVARELGIEASSLEGYLYPETYRFRRETPPREVLGALVREFESRWTEDDRARLRAAKMSRHEVVTLASIVEKESAVPEERKLIAAVFLNRIGRRMRLQSDPTVIYGLVHSGAGFDGNIRRRDLRADTVYNTYTRAGLPPGPIASTTIESIRAVLEPDDVSYLYFVSRGNGTHQFSSTLREHNRAVDRYQRRRRRPSAS